MPDRLMDIGRSDRFGQRQRVAGDREFSGRKARQGRIVLNTPLRRAIFVGGLVIAVIGAFILGYLA
jgi:hypothetical protein